MWPLRKIYIGRRGQDPCSIQENKKKPKKGNQVQKKMREMMEQAEKQKKKIGKK